ncbi:endonuclease/exonuclease/phosphatase family protein [Consotaella aegiceratis]|uniref:endonuclease/exonuclease/phosphatase family protein n=1 Tax=Consotaella aegiceratis TaxID=3097961 RepID=UPI002F414552
MAHLDDRSVSALRDDGTAVTAAGLFSAVVLGAMILAGFQGRHVHALDSLSHFRVHLAVLLVLVVPVLLVTGQWLAGLACVLVAVVGLSSAVPYLVSQPEDAPLQDEQPRYTLLQMNLLYDAEDHRPTLQRINEIRPDVITLQEASPRWMTSLAGIRDSYPYQYFCGGTSARDKIAILSRRPFAGDWSTCRRDDGLAARDVDFDGTPVRIGSIHLNWPWPSHQWRQIGWLQPILAGFPGRSLLAGDFNAAPWSAAVTTVAQAGSMRVTPGIGPTWIHARLPTAWAGRVGLPLDNVIAGSQIRHIATQRLRPTASDHLPVLVAFSVVPLPKHDEEDISGGQQLASKQTILNH